MYFSQRRAYLRLPEYISYASRFVYFITAVCSSPVMRCWLNFAFNASCSMSLGGTASLRDSLIMCFHMQMTAAFVLRCLKFFSRLLRLTELRIISADMHTVMLTTAMIISYTHDGTRRALTVSVSPFDPGGWSCSFAPAGVCAGGVGGAVGSCGDGGVGD